MGRLKDSSGSGNNWRSYRGKRLDKVLDDPLLKDHDHFRVALDQFGEWLHDMLEEKGDQFQVIGKIVELFEHLKEEAEMHMEKEELMIFPYAQTLMATKGRKKQGFTFDSAKEPVKLLDHEHKYFNKMVKDLEKRLNKFIKKAKLDQDEQKGLNEVLQLKKKWQQHLDIEENIFFPGLIQLEEEKKKEK